VVIAATNLSGKQSTPHALSFTIVKG
jgi:hypothetical protein